MKGRVILKKETIYRFGFYLLALLVLALGLELNSKTGLGVSPIISIAYSTSVLFQINFPDMTLILYVVFVIMEIVIHSIRKEEKSRLILDALQLPLSLVFTRFMHLFDTVIPDYTMLAGTFFGTMAGRIILLLIAIALTGIGAALSLNMHIVPNPGDGIVQAIAECIQKKVGFTKNCVDAVCIVTSIVISLCFIGHLEGVAIGTFIAMIGTGRCIALFNYLTQNNIMRVCGLANE